MAISFIGQATGTDTATMPTHAAGDLIIVHAYRGSTALAPTLVSGFTSINSTAANSNGVTAGYKVAASSSEVVGTWTNAEVTLVQVYRGVAASPIGGSAVFTGLSTFIYPAVTMAVGDGSSWVAAFAGARANSTAIETAPSGMVNRSNTTAGSAYEAAGHDTNGGVSSWAQVDTTVTTGGSRFRSISIEIKAGASSGSPYTLPVSTTAVTVTGSNAAAKADRRTPVTTSAVSLAGSSVTLVYTPATAPKTLAVTSAPVTVSGSSITARLARSLAVSTAATTLTGSAVSVVYTPATGPKVLPVSSGQVTLSGSDIGFVHSGKKREVNWPFSNGSSQRKKAEDKAREQAALVRMLLAQRQKREEATQPPQSRKVAREVIREATQAGLLSAPTAELQRPIQQAITGSLDIRDVLAKVALIEREHHERLQQEQARRAGMEQALIEAAWDDEAAALLLLAAWIPRAEGRGAPIRNITNRKTE